MMTVQYSRTLTFTGPAVQAFPEHAARNRQWEVDGDYLEMFPTVFDGTDSQLVNDRGNVVFEACSLVEWNWEMETWDDFVSDISDFFLEEWVENIRDHAEDYEEAGLPFFDLVAAAQAGCALPPDAMRRTMETFEKVMASGEDKAFVAKHVDTVPDVQERFEKLARMVRVSAEMGGMLVVL